MQQQAEDLAEQLGDLAEQLPTSMRTSGLLSDGNDQEPSTELLTANEQNSNTDTVSQTGSALGRGPKGTHMQALAAIPEGEGISRKLFATTTPGSGDNDRDNGDENQVRI